MQVLYQLSYGPLANGRALGSIIDMIILHRERPQTCRQTATRRP